MASFSQLDRDEAVAMVSARTLNNIRVTHKILTQCAANGWAYRVSSNLFPLLTYNVANLKLVDYPDYIDISGSTRRLRQRCARQRCSYLLPP